MALGKTLTKNQHYVPQLLLRGFTTDIETKKVHIFDVTSRQTRPNQSIDKVFSQNYFYDKDNNIEEFLSSSIESPAGIIINQFRDRNFGALNSNDTSLIKFICVQNSRTVESREDTLNFTNAFFQQFIAEYIELNNLDISDPTLFSIRPAGKEALMSFNARNALNGVYMSKGMEDLKFHILINNTDTDFIISDHPVTRYNWLYREMQDPRIASLFIKGVQLFLPLSDKIYLCAYDSKIYKYGNRRSDVSSIENLIDVHWLNQLQMQNAGSFVAFSSLSSESHIKNIHTNWYGKKIYLRKATRASSPKSRSHNPNNIEERKTIIYTYSEQLKLHERPSFFKIIKASRTYAREIIERDPDVSAAVEMLLKRANESTKKDDIDYRT